MVRPISNDLRKRAVAAVAKGESCRAVAVRFGVAVSSVVKWSQRYRATGSVAPGKMGGHRKPILEPHRAFIKEISQTPHLTLHALKDELAARGVKVSHNAVWLFLRREGLRFKKTLLALEQARSDIARRRSVAVHGRPSSILGAWSLSTRPGSRPTWPHCADGGQKGERVRSFAPHGHWQTLTFLGALRCDRLTAPCLFDGPINGECFRAYVQQVLVPQLQPGDIDQSRRRQALVPAAILPRPQSNRTDLRQDQALHALRPEAHP